MHPDAIEELKALLNKNDDESFPRLFYLGHKVLYTYQPPDRRAKWECQTCKHQWIGEDGAQCPDCKDCKHVWEWVSEPYGPEDRACTHCGISLEQSMGKEKFDDYIQREQESRKRRADGFGRN